MSIKEKIKSTLFWRAVLIFSILYPLISESLIMWWNYDLNFAELRENRLFENDFFLYALTQFIKGLIVGILVLLISYKEKGKASKAVTNK